MIYIAQIGYPASNGGNLERQLQEEEVLATENAVRLRRKGMAVQQIHDVLAATPPRLTR